VDRDCLRSSGHPWRGGRGGAAEGQNLAGFPQGTRGPTAPGGNLPAEDRDRDQLQTRGSRTRPYYPHFCRPRKCRGTTVCIVRANIEDQRRQGLHGGHLADGGERCGQLLGRSLGRRRPPRPRQSVEIEPSARIGRCGRKHHSCVWARKNDASGSRVPVAHASPS